MKPIINISRNILILCLCLVALAGLHCKRRGDRTSAHESKIKFLVFLPLVTLDEDLEPQGRLAQRWEHSPDYREWTFHLRQDVWWHDGVPVTADDIKFSIEMFASPDVPFYSAFWYDIETITVCDDFTLAITFSKPTNVLDCWWDVYYPKHLLEDLDPKEYGSWKFWMEPVGNGPYRYFRHVPKTMVELEANPDYYLSKPKIERVVYKFGGNPLIELLSGNVDFVHIDPIDIHKVVEDKRFRIYHHVSGSWIESIWWNHRHSFFGERQFQRGELPEPLPYDPELAKQLLDEAGWRDEDGNGIRELAGQEFRFTANATEGRVLAATYIQDQFRRVGVRMEIQPLAPGVGQKGKDFEARFKQSWNSMGSESKRIGTISLFGAGQEESRIGYQNPAVVALLDEAKKTTVPEELELIYRKLMPIIGADLPVTFLYLSCTRKSVFTSSTGAFGD
jgi:peptide/nickel transport system substrate-binding protein